MIQIPVPEPRSDREIVLAAVQQHGRSLQYADGDAKTDPEVVEVVLGGRNGLGNANEQLTGWWQLNYFFIFTPKIGEILSRKEHELFWRYCWWKSGGHQVRLVVFPIIYKEILHPRHSAGFLPSAVWWYFHVLEKTAITGGQIKVGLHPCRLFTPLKTESLCLKN